MESTGIIPIVLTAMGVVAAVLLGVWGIAARYDSVVVDRIVRVCRQASTNLRARSSFDRASGASSRSRSPSSRAAWSEKDRNPYNRRSSARCSCRVSDRTA